MTDDEAEAERERRRRVIEEARQTIARLDAQPRDDVIRRVLYGPDDPPIECREWRLPEPAPERRKQKPDTDPSARWDMAALDARFNVKIEAALAEERATLVGVIETVGERINDMLDQEHEEQRKALALEVRELRLELVKLETVLAEVRIATAGRTLDLGAPSAKTVN